MRKGNCRPPGGYSLIRDQVVRLGGGRGGTKERLVRRTLRRSRSPQTLPFPSRMPTATPYKGRATGEKPIDATDWSPSEAWTAGMIFSTIVALFEAWVLLVEINR
jgi:hypothetical protein